MPVAINGVRGTGSFSADERPQNWRQAILAMFPNGTSPLTALLSKAAQEATNDPLFNWFEKGLPIRRGLIVGAGTNPAAKPADNADIAAADATAEISLTVKPDGGAEDDLTWLKAGTVLLNQTTEEVYIVTKKNADWIVVRRDVGNKFASNPAVTGDASAGDPIVIVGSGFPENAPVGDAINQPPIRHSNNTQIFRTPLQVSRTARMTTMRTDQQGPYRELKREALQNHGIDLEFAFLFGEREIMTSYTNSDTVLSGTTTGKPNRTTRGILNWLPTISVSAAVPSVHWDINAAFAGGLSELVFDQWCEEVFRYGSDKKMLFVGSTAANVLNQLAKNKLTIQGVPSDQTYGMDFVTYVTPFGRLMVRQHPLLSNDPVWRKDAFCIDLPHLKYRYITDTRFLTNRQNNGDDGTVDEYLTEAGLECRFSGAASDSAGGLSGAAGPAVHGRLKGLASFIG